MSQRSLRASFFAASLAGVSVGASAQALPSMSHARTAAGPVVPGFTIEIKLSPLAHSELARLHETIMVSAEVYGQPRPGFDPGPGGVLLARPPRLVLALDAKAVFGPITLNQAALKNTDSTEPEVLLNVFSGRNSSPDNLLACDFFQGPLKTLQRKPLTLDCRLIAEERR